MPRFTAPAKLTPLNQRKNRAIGRLITAITIHIAPNLPEASAVAIDFKSFRITDEPKQSW